MVAAPAAGGGHGRGPEDSVPLHCLHTQEQRPALL